MSVFLLCRVMVDWLELIVFEDRTFLLELLLNCWTVGRCEICLVKLCSILLYCVLCEVIFDVVVQCLVMSDIVYTAVLEAVFDIVLLGFVK